MFRPRHAATGGFIFAFMMCNSSVATAQMYGYGYAGPRYHFSTRNFAPIPPQYFGGLQPVMPVRPLTPVNGFNPLMFNPLNPRYSPQLNATMMYYGFNRLYNQSGYSPAATFTPTSSAYVPAYGTTNRYLSARTAARDYGYAQAAAASTARLSRDTIVKQGQYEKGVKPFNGDAKNVKPDADGPLARALAAENEAEIATGAPANVILAAAAALDRGDKMDSDLLSPQLFAALRFTGSPDADLLSAIQDDGKLAFPEAFLAEPLAEQKVRIERDFAAAVAPALAGRANDPVKGAALETTLRASRDMLNGAIRDMEFADATAARRFVNRLDSAATALKKAGVAAAVVPRWRTEGVATAELVRHMTRFKMQFAPAPKENEEAYTALQRALSKHLFALMERNGGKSK